MGEVLNGNEDGLISYYKFNAGTGDTLYDHSGNQNHGTIHGATWAGCTDPLADNYLPNANVDDGSCMGSPVNASDFIPRPALLLSLAASEVITPSATPCLVPQPAL